jgi:membrane protein implicated in regulation of membrane protease activity
LSIPVWQIVVIVVIIVVVLAFVIYWSIRAHQKKVASGKEELVGRTAVVEVALDPKGVVFIEGERWTAIAEGGHAEPEEEVIITKVEGLKLYVTKKI